MPPWLSPEEAYFGEGDDEDLAKRFRGASTAAGEDPLDAFMAEIDSEIAKTSLGAKGFEKQMEKAQALWEEENEVG